MRETNFIKQNKEKWEEYEELLEKKSKDPDKLNRLFVQLTDDLSYSRTFYPNRSVRVYLNNLGQQIFYNIYKNKRNPVSRFLSFWTDELPRLVYESRVSFRLAFVIFIVSMIIGAFSAQMNPEFPRVILGDAYVDMTIENIETGDPMAVYKDKGQLGMSLGITANNLFVAFLTFLLGVFFGIGTIGILINNGVMVGSFQHFFYDKGVFQESFLTIWTHGTLEISAIVIAGAAGLTMGRGLVFPGTLSRLQSFQISARRGLKIMLGLVPIFIAAGFIEGYLTRYTETPDAVRLMFILMCLFFILGYFVWYPVKRAREGFKTKRRDTKIPPTMDFVTNYSNIKSSGEILADSFSIIRRNLKLIVWYSSGLATVFAMVVGWMSETPLNESFAFTTEFLGAFMNSGQYFSNEAVPLLPFLNILLYSLFFYMVVQILLKTYHEDQGTASPIKDTKQNMLDFFSVMIGVSIGVVLLAIDLPFMGLIFFLLAPFLLLAIFISQKEERFFLSAFSRSFFLAKQNVGAIVGMYFVVGLLGFLFYSILDTSILWFYLQMLGWNVSVEQETMDQLVNSSMIFISVNIFALILALFMTSFSLLYYSLVESREAPWLHAAVEEIGKYRMIRGMEKE